VTERRAGLPPNLNADTAAELRKLRAEITAMRAAAGRVHVRHGWLRYIVKDLETNPHTQYKVHLWGAVYWLINFPLVTWLFFDEPRLWLKLGIFITLVYSIYANFTTDYGSMSAAMAAFGPPAPEIPLSPHVEPEGTMSDQQPEPGDPGTSPDEVTAAGGMTLPAPAAGTDDGQ
jgi:hypothetical protein